MAATHEAGEIRVWRKDVSDNTGGAKGWMRGPWTEEKRLIPERSVTARRGRGNASFRLLKRTHMEPGDSYRVWPDTPNAGDPVCITTGAGASPNDAGVTILWLGYVTRIIGNTVAGSTTDETGIVEAVEFGHLFHEIALDNWQATSAAGQVEPMTLSEPPIANPSTAKGLIGNRANASADQLLLGRADSLFLSDPASCGTADADYWTRFDILSHAVDECIPDGWPQISFTGGSNIVDNSGKYETMDLREQTLGSLLDMIAGEERGLTYDVTTDATDALIINIKTVSELGSGDLPANAGADIELPLGVVGMEFVTVEQYDQVIVEGSPVVSCGTVKIGTGSDSGVIGWDSGTLQTSWGNALSGDAGYPSETAERKSKNSGFRARNEVKDVFARFEIALGTYDELLCETGTSPSTQFLCPELEWDGSTLTVSSDLTALGNKSPLAQQAKILTWLPMSANTDESNTDGSGDARKGSSDHASPLVVAQDIQASNIYRDLSKPGAGISPASFQPDPIGPGFRINCDSQERLAGTRWNAGWGQGLYFTEGETSPDSTVTGGIYDYDTMEVTLAVQSGQRLQVTKTRSGVTYPRKVARISKPELQAWLVRKGTVTGFDNNDALVRYASDTFTRNDYPIAQKIADEIAGYLFRNRTEWTITLAGCDRSDSFLTPGYMIGNIDEVDRFVSVGGAETVDVVATHVANTAVDSISRTYTGTLTTSFSTATAPLPDGLVGVAPRTAPIAKMARDIASIKAQTEQPRNVPVIAPSPSTASQSALRETITQAAHGFSAGDVVNLQSGTWTACTESSTRSLWSGFGVIESVTTDTFEIVYKGPITLSGLTADTQYFLDGTTVSTNRTIIPVYYATSTTTAFVDNRIYMESPLLVTDSISSGTYTASREDGRYHEVTVSGDIALNTNNWAGANTGETMTILLIESGGSDRTITLNSSWYNNLGDSYVLPSGSRAAVTLLRGSSGIYVTIAPDLDT